MARERKEKRAERLQVMMNLKEVKAVEEWRFEHRMPSRSAAVRALMNLGLQSETNTDEADVLLQSPVPSGGVGVVELDRRTEEVLTKVRDRRRLLIIAADQLDCLGIKLLLENAGCGIAEIVMPMVGLRFSGNSAKPDIVVHELPSSGFEAKSLHDQIAKTDIPIVFFRTERSMTTVPEELAFAPLLERDALASQLVPVINTLLGHDEPLRA